MSDMKNGVNRVALVVAVVLLVVLAGLFAWREWGSGTSTYYAVALRNGDVYFGRLSRFPSFGLKQVYVLQFNQANTQNPVTVQRFKNAFWGPEDFLQINRNEVVWMTRLNPEGQLARLIASNPELALPSTPPAAPPATAPPQ